MENKKETIEQIDDILGEKTKLNKKKSILLLEEISKKLSNDNEFGQKTKDDIIKLLNKILSKEALSKDDIVLLQKTHKDISDLRKEESNKLSFNMKLILHNLNKIFEKEYPKEFDVNVKNQVKMLDKIEIKNPQKVVRVENLDEITFPESTKYPEEIKVNNFPKQKAFPKDIEISKVKKPVEISRIKKPIEVAKPKWFKKFDNFEFLNDLNEILIKISNNVVEKITEISNKTFKANINTHKNPKQAIAVKIIGKDDRVIEDFSPKVAVSAGGGSGIGGNIGLKNIAQDQLNPATEEKQDSIVTAVNNVSGLQRSTNMEGNGKIEVGTSEVEITFTGTPESVIIAADKDNTGLIFIGKTGMDSSGANAIIFLNPSDVYTADYDDTSNAIYVISDTATQNVWAGALL